MASRFTHNRDDDEIRKIMAVHAKVGAEATRQRFGITKGGFANVLRRFAKMKAKDALQSNPSAAGNLQPPSNLAGALSPLGSGLSSIRDDLTHN